MPDTYPDIMIDIETAGTRPGCAILTIGAVAFDRAATDLSAVFAVTSDRSLYLRVDLVSSILAGFTVEPETIAWWRRQDHKAVAEAFTAGERLPIYNAITLLSLFVRDFGTPDVRVWSRGTAFDFPVLEAALDTCGVPIPWQYHRTHDVRTLLDAAGIDKSTPDIPHDALHDAIAQARDVQRAWQVLRQDAAAQPTDIAHTIPAGCGIVGAALLEHRERNQ